MTCHRFEGGFACANVYPRRPAPEGDANRCPVRGCRRNVGERVMCAGHWLRMCELSTPIHERLLTAIVYARHNPDHGATQEALQRALADALHLLDADADA